MVESGHFLELNQVLNEDRDQCLHKTICDFVLFSFFPMRVGMTYVTHSVNITCKYTIYMLFISICLDGLKLTPPLDDMYKLAQTGSCSILLNTSCRKSNVSTDTGLFKTRSC